MFVDPTVLARAEDLNPKSFPVGSVVYFLRSRRGTSQKVIDFGTVIDHYTGEIAIQLYEPADTTTVEGVPAKEFVTPTEWRKLPKGWSWDTKLIQYGHIEISGMYDPFDVKDPACIKSAIERGIFVRVCENDHAGFRAEIDRNNGWRIVRDYYGVEERLDYCTVFYTHCYATYEEAQAELEAIQAECDRQASLSDKEWSIEQIDKNLDRWARLYSISDEDKRRARDRLLALNNIEDVVTRISCGALEWKYDRNKRWMRVEL